MKALSIKQPWANLLASGEKTIETRLWPTAYRGPLLIVSSKTPKIHPAGCALAIAELVDCRLMTKSDEAAACCACYPGAFSWVMRDIRKIAVFPVRGKLGLYDVSMPSRIDNPEPGSSLDLFPDCPLSGPLQYPLQPWQTSAVCG
jgi:hypothetical protein